MPDQAGRETALVCPTCQQIGYHAVRCIKTPPAREATPESGCYQAVDPTIKESHDHAE